MGGAADSLRRDGFLRGPLAAVALIVFVVAPACAANDAVIDPDRPDTTNSANPVAKGRVQLETGAFYRRTSEAGGPAERRLSWEATVRIGIANDVEFRIDSEPVVRVDNSREETDVGDFTLGLKYRVVSTREGEWWPALALNPFVKLPTAQEPIGSGETDAGLLLLASFNLPSDFALDVNAGAVLVGQPSGHLVQARASASLSRRLIDGLSGFAELAFSSRDTREGRDGLVVQAGVIWRLTRDVALDTALSTSLAGAAPDFGVRAGVSIRFGR
ncbi:MAG TPA: transporter [Methylomirabilota bacterium]